MTNRRKSKKQKSKYPVNHIIKIDDGVGGRAVMNAMQLPGAVTVKANFNAKVGETIAGNLVRGAGGKFSAGGGSASKKPKKDPVQAKAPAAPKLAGGGKYTPPKAAKGKGGGKKSGGKGKAGKTAKPKKTPEQKVLEENTNAGNVSAKLLGDDLAEVLTTGNKPGDLSGVKPEYAEQLVSKGLAVHNRDGSYSMTPAGNAYLNAAKKGDAQKAKDILERSQDKTAAGNEKANARNNAKLQKTLAGNERRKAVAERRAQVKADREKKTADRKAAQEAKAADRARKKAEADKKRAAKGGKGGGAGKANPVDKAKEKAARAQAVAERRATADKAKATTHAGKVKDRLDRLNLRQQQLDERRKAGKVSQLQYDQEQARIKLERSQTKEIDGSSTITVYKSAGGQYRWLFLSSNNYQDRDRQWVSRAALEADCLRADKEKNYGPLRWWHVGSLAGGLDIGDCDFNAIENGFLIESGTFKNAAIAEAVARNADRLGVSIGFLHPITEPDSSGVFHNIRRFERSLLPASAASNPLTHIKILEANKMPLTEQKIKEFMALVGPEQAEPLLDAVMTQIKNASAAAAGQGLTTKAASATVTADAPAADPGAMPEGTDGDGQDDEAAEENDYIGDMSQADFEAFLTPLITNAVAAAMGGSTSATTKAASDAAQALTSVEALKTQIAALQTQLKELTEDAPPITRRAVNDPGNVVGTTKQVAAPAPDSLDAVASMFAKQFSNLFGGAPAGQ